MTDTIFSSAYRVEHFTGWDGTGTPTYSGTDSTNLDPNNLNSLVFKPTGASTANINTQVCWQNVLLDTSDDIWINFEFCVYRYRNVDPIRGGIVLSIIDNTSNKGLTIQNGNWASSPLVISNSTYSTTNRITSGTTISSQNIVLTEKIPTTYTLNITRSTGDFSLYSRNNLDFTSSTLIYSGNSVNLVGIGQNIDLIYGASNASYLYPMAVDLYYSYVTNFDTRNTYLNYETISTQGSYDQWSGDTTGFSTYPVNYSSTSNQSATGANQVTTFTGSTMTVPNNMQVIGITCSAPINIVTDGTEMGASFVTSPGNNQTYSISSTYSFNSNISKGIVINSTVNPVTNLSWTLDNLNKYEFGMERTK